MALTSRQKSGIWMVFAPTVIVFVVLSAYAIINTIFSFGGSENKENLVLNLFNLFLPFFMMAMLPAILVFLIWGLIWIFKKPKQNIKKDKEFDL